MSEVQENLDEMLGRAERAFSISRWEAALEAYEEALAADAECLEARAQAGRCRIRLGQTSEGAADLERAISASELPDVAWIVELGEAYVPLDKDDEAASCFKAALERDPNRAEAFAGMGLLYLRKGAYQMAKTALERTVTLGPLEPRLASARNNLAIVYCYLGDYERAAEQLSAARNLGYPVDPSFREMLARQLFGGDPAQKHQEKPS